MKKDRFYRTYPIVGYTLFLIALLTPLCMALVPSFLTSDGISLQTILATFTDMEALRTMAETAVIAIVCTTVCTLLGWFGASILCRYSLGGEGLLKGIYGFGILVPGSVTALGIQTLLGNGGLFELPPVIAGVDRNLILIAYTMAIRFTPIVILMVSYYWKRLDYRCEQAARTLGVSGGKAFRSVTLPWLRPAIVQAACLVFIACMTTFSTISLLDSSTTCRTAYLQVLGTLENPSVASCFALFHMVIGLAVLAIFCSMQKKMASRITKESANHRRQEQAKGFVRNVAILLYLMLSILLTIAPMVSVITHAILDDLYNVTISHFVTLFADLEAKALLPLAYSLAIAVIGSLLATRIALALCVSIYRKKDGKTANGFVAMLPLSLGSLLLGFGFHVLNAYVPQIPSLVLVALSHTLMITPIAVILASPAFSAVESDLIPASRTLGYNAAQSFRLIEKPAVRPAVAAAFLIGLVISVGDSANALAVAGNDAKTLSVLLFNEYSNGSLGSASALGCVLIAISLIVFLIGERLMRKCHV